MEGAWTPGRQQGAAQAQVEHWTVRLLGWGYSSSRAAWETAALASAARARTHMRARHASAWACGRHAVLSVAGATSRRPRGGSQQHNGVDAQPHLLKQVCEIKPLGVHLMG